MLDQLLTDLDSPDDAIREEAIRQAGALSSEELRELAKREAAYSRPNYLRGGVYAALGLGVPLLLLEAVVLLSRHTTIPDWLERHGLGVLLGYCLLFAFGMGAYGKPRRARNSIARIVEKTDDVRMLSLIFNILDQPFSRTHESANQALLRLLPQVRREHAETWTPTQRGLLHTVLNTPLEKFELTLAILKMVEQVGDGRDLTDVQKLTRIKPARIFWMKPFNLSYAEALERVQRIQQAAVECLAYLEANIAQQKHSETLLRAAAPAAREHLLRPATAAHVETEATELLRPRTGEE